MSTAFHTVHVRVNDAATGQPTPCRVRFTGPDGTYYAPFGRLTEFALGCGDDVGGNVQLLLDGDEQLETKKYAYIDGSCEIRLPAGLIGVEIHKGPEYQSVSQQLSVGLGKMALRFTLQRWCDLRQDRWYSGDIRAYYLTPHAALLEGAAEDLAVVNLLATDHLSVWSHGTQNPKGKPLEQREYASVSNILAFSGQKPALEMPGHMVVVNTHNQNVMLGALALLNCHRVVYPLSFGVGKDGFDDWTLAAWCDQCHRKGGLVVWIPILECISGFSLGDSEALADLILGRVDAIHVTGPVSPEWHGLLNCGFRVPLVAGSRKTSNWTPLGEWRTYARLAPGEEFTYKTWIEAIRAGRTFVTNGPILSFTVNGRGPGEDVEVSSPGQTVQVRAEARSLEPFNRVRVFYNGSVVAETPDRGPVREAVVEAEVPVSMSGWLTANCRARPALPRAESSPIYVTVPGEPIRPSALTTYVERLDDKLHPEPAWAAYLFSHLDRMLRWAETQASCSTEQQRENLAAIFRDARAKLTQRTKGR